MQVFLCRLKLGVVCIIQCLLLLQHVHSMYNVLVHINFVRVFPIILFSTQTWLRLLVWLQSILRSVFFFSPIYYCFFCFLSVLSLLPLFQSYSILSVLTSVQLLIEHSHAKGCIDIQAKIRTGTAAIPLLKIIFQMLKLKVKF